MGSESIIEARGAINGSDLDYEECTCISLMGRRILDALPIPL